MNLYTQSGLMYVELTVLFPDCSIKFETMQQVHVDKSPVQSLSFHKYMSTSEYDCLNMLNINSKLISYLFLPEQSKLTEMQRNICDGFMINLMSSDMTVAETIDEKAEFIYLIIHLHKFLMFPQQMFLPSFMSQSQFGIFQFKFEELWSVQPNMIFFMKNLHLNNSIISKQLLEVKNSMAVYKQYMTNWSVAQVNKEKLYKKQLRDLKKKKRDLEESAKPEDLDPQICILCYQALKKIVFLPCGHISVCKDCAIDSMSLELNKIFYKKANAKTCPVCEVVIKEAREVFI